MHAQLEQVGSGGVGTSAGGEKSDKRVGIVDRVKEYVGKFAAATDAHFPEGEKDWYQSSSALDAAHEVKDATESMVDSLHIDEMQEHLGEAHALLRTRMSIEAGLSRNLSEAERGSQGVLEFMAKNYDSVSGRVASADQQAASYLSRMQDIGSKMALHVKQAHDEHDRLKDQVKYAAEYHTIDARKLAELEERRQYLQALNAKLIEVRAREEARSKEPPVPLEVQQLTKEIAETEERNGLLKKWLDVLQKRARTFEAALEHMEVGGRDPKDAVVETIQESKMRLRQRLINPLIEQADAENASFIKKQVLRSDELEKIQATFQLSEESRKAVNKKFRDPMTASGALEEEVVVEMAEYQASMEAELKDIAAAIAELPTLEGHNRKVAQRLEMICSPQRHGEYVTGEAQPHVEVLLTEPHGKDALLEELTVLHKEDLEPLGLRILRYEQHVLHAQAAFEKIRQQRQQLLDFVSTERKSAAMQLLKSMLEKKEGRRINTADELQKECSTLIEQMIAQESHLRHGVEELDSRLALAEELVQDTVAECSRLRGFMDRNRWEAEDFGLVASTGTESYEAMSLSHPLLLQSRRTREKTQLALLSDNDVDDDIIDAIHERSRIMHERLKQARDAGQKAAEAAFEAAQAATEGQVEEETEEFMVVLRSKLKLLKSCQTKKETQQLDPQALFQDFVGLQSAELPLALDSSDLQMLQKESLDMAKDLENAMGNFKTQVMLQGGHPLDPERVKELDGEDRAKRFIADRCRELVTNRRRWWEIRQVLPQIPYMPEEERPMQVIQRQVMSLLHNAKDGDYSQLSGFLADSGSTLHKACLIIQTCARGWLTRRSPKGKAVATAVAALRSQFQQRRLAQMSVHRIRRDSLGGVRISPKAGAPPTPGAKGRKIARADTVVLAADQEHPKVPSADRRKTVASTPAVRRGPGVSIHTAEDSDSSLEGSKAAMSPTARSSLNKSPSNPSAASGSRASIVRTPNKSKLKFAES
mmetsp:Transcript_25930/g.59924  ORF Transcript_25930/g.59924 Transcript_25930/m.59924 type:complete len:991 (+) Transcript_25930:122-3094(+)